MAERTLSRLYDGYADASATVRDLEEAGFAHSDVSLLGPNNANGYGDEAAVEPDQANAAGAGATVGTVLGGGAGLLAGLGSLAIPGIGPLVAAGWLIATITGAGAGAAAGGIIGALTGSGHDEEEAHVYAEGVRRGGTLVSVRTTTDTRVAEAERILDRRNPVDPSTRRADYHAAGWTGFDEAAGPYTGASGLPNGTPGSRNQLP